MDILSAQTAVAQEHCASNGVFSAALGRLLDALMRSAGDNDWSGKFPNFVDGVLFETETRQVDFFAGHGIAYVTGNQSYVEPISATLSFDPVKIEMVSAVIRFGMLNSKKPFPGSSDVRKIIQSVLAMASGSRPKLPFNWRYEFTLVDGVWSNCPSD